MPVRRKLGLVSLFIILIVQPLILKADTSNRIQFTRDTVVSKGLFNLTVDKDRYYFEIPDSLLGRDILVVNRIAQSAAQLRKPEDGSGYATDLLAEKVIRFEKNFGNKIFLKQISFVEPAGEAEDGMHPSVIQSNLQPVIRVFENKGGVQHVWIDVTDLIKEDNDLLFFPEDKKRGARLGQFHPDKSFVSSVQVFAEHIEIKTVKTYSRTPPNNQVYPPPPLEAGFATLELNSSWIVLSKIPMRPRLADPRINYFKAEYLHYSTQPYGVEKVKMITRWRLEPKEEDKMKYLKGELVEPKKPIVFYIDPTMPEKWIPYVMDGVNAWQKAFEKAGFKNAIMAKRAPFNDPGWSIVDTKHSAMVWVPSAMANGTGPNVHDPRSGEIIEAHATIDHNVTEIAQKWYLIQAGAIDRRAQKVFFDDELMGKLIRYISSHEVGHSLGLDHNFRASSTVPVEKLRDKNWLDQHGHTPSIMDYARFNYVAQPEDGITEKGILPSIGEYDEWAIEWGYRWFAEKSIDQEQRDLSNWIIRKTKENERLQCFPADGPDNPKSLNIDLGNNAMIAGRYGIKNLKRILPHLVEWTSVPGKDYERTKQFYQAFKEQFGAYTTFARTNIGGVLYDALTSDQPGSTVAFVPKHTQQEAMAFLQAELFTTPTWLIDRQIFNTIGESAMETIGYQQNLELTQLLNVRIMSNLLKFEADKGKEAYSLTEMLTELQDGIFSEIRNGLSISIYRRNLQKMFVEKMMALMIPSKSTYGQPNPLTLDISSEIKSHLKALKTIIATALPRIKDAQSKNHLLDLTERLTVNSSKNQVNP